MDNIAGKLVREELPLQRTLNDHGDSIQQLSNMISTLEDRLMPVRNSVSTDDSNTTAMPQRIGSPIVYQLLSQTDIVFSLQQRVSALLGDLEV